MQLTINGKPEELEGSTVMEILKTNIIDPTSIG